MSEDLKNIKELADEIGVSKQAVWQKIKKESSIDLRQKKEIPFILESPSSPLNSSNAPFTTPPTLSYCTVNNLSRRFSCTFYKFCKTSPNTSSSKNKNNN